MTENDKQFLKNLVNLNENILKAQQYIKENFNVDSTYDEETTTLHLTVDNINEALSVTAAKEYVNTVIGEHLVACVYDY